MTDLLGSSQLPSLVSSFDNSESQDPPPSSTPPSSFKPQSAISSYVNLNFGDDNDNNLVLDPGCLDDQNKDPL